MKKISVLFVILFTVFFFAACGADEEEGDVTGDTENNGENGSGNNEGNNGGEETEDTEQTDSDEEPVNQGGIYVTCTPGETRPCYEGPSGTDGVGVCKSGIAT